MSDIACGQIALLPEAWQRTWLTQPALSVGVSFRPLKPFMEANTILHMLPNWNASYQTHLFVERSVLCAPSINRLQSVDCDGLLTAESHS
jgi:hypothetical protein